MSVFKVKLYGSQSKANSFSEDADGPNEQSKISHCISENTDMLEPVACIHQSYRKL